MLMTNTMNRKTMLTLAAAVGLALSLPAMSAVQNQDMGNDRTQSREQEQSRAYMFQSADELLGKTLKNAQGNELATIDDMVVNRGTGRIEAIVIREGGFLGFGGTHVAIPFDAFDLDKANLTLTLNASENMLEGDDKTLPTRWERLEDDWDEDLNALVVSRDAMTITEEPVDRDTETKTISGTITKIDRIDLGDKRHWLAVRIGEAGNESGNETNGDAKEGGQWVVLGPAWYSTGGVGAPVRGQRIEVETFNGHGDKMHAKSATIDGERVRYRDDNMNPMWTNRVPRSASEWTPGPMVLLTNVLDENVIWGRSDDEVGEVTDAVIELSTGHLAVLAIDPDGDWWGRDIVPRAVPFDIARVGQDDITLDATRTMLGGAEVMPEDVRSMTMPRTREAVFVVFEVSPPVYER